MTKPNVLLIVTDHWFASLLGCAGHPSVQTPVLDQLAKNGVRFTNAYAAHPVCLPSRRSLMTGTTAKTHGDRTFKPLQPMPNVPTLAQTFRDAGYQAKAVGKLHVYPQRNYIGFDDVILDDEGRTHYSSFIDDYELFLGDMGYTGQRFGHGMSNNNYFYRAWHLPDHLHVTDWATTMTERAIKRRDPTRPAFWYVGYSCPHPPLVPLQSYLDFYRDTPIDEPFVGGWATDRTTLPYHAQAVHSRNDNMNERTTEQARRAFYALCTHIDHHIGRLIGTLHWEGLLEDTIIMFTSDHGDMLGNHGMWAKQVFYENSTNIPMILMGAKDDPRVGLNRTDERLVEIRDVMPTLLDLCNIPIPETVEGLSMLGDEKRDTLYGEYGESSHASRMVRDERYKLIWYPCGNHFQLFDLHEDPNELNDLAYKLETKEIQERLSNILRDELYGSDIKWMDGAQLVGEAAKTFRPGANRSLSATRGNQWPVPPITDKAAFDFFNEAPE
ncbi:MAG: sulfatase-like hydrolase/transferase [Chloroflexota bacterium]